MREGVEREAAEAGCGIRFADGRDLTEVVIPQYKEGFLQVMSGASELGYAMLSWGDDEMASLVDSLLYLHDEGRPLPAKVVLFQNSVTDRGALALAEANGRSGGALAAVAFDLKNNRIGFKGCEALAAAGMAGVDTSFNPGDVRMA